MNRVPRCRLPPTPGTNLVAASSAPERCKLLQSFFLHAAQRPGRQQQHRRARARLSDQLLIKHPFRPGKAYYCCCPGGLYTTPGSASQAGPGSSLSFSPPPTPLARRSPPREIYVEIHIDQGTSLLYFFVFVPSIIQHPHRGTALFYPYASVSHTPTRPPRLGGSTPVWANTNLVPSLPLFISRGLTTPASPLLPHTSLPTAPRIYVQSARHHQQPSAKDHPSPSLLYLCLPLSHRPGLSSTHLTYLY